MKNERQEAIAESICTWVGCQEKATIFEIGEAGEVCAPLCPAHHAAMAEAIDSLNPYRILAAWIKAGNF